MSAEEMNALERAALEDPFLSDAIEGYTGNTMQLKSDSQKDIEDLQHRLRNRLGKNHKVIAVHAFKWWKVAAVIVLLAGAGALVYTLTNTTRQTETLAKNDATTPLPPTLQDTLNGNIISLNEPAAGVMEKNADQLPAPAPKIPQPSGNKKSGRENIESSQIITSEKRSIKNDKPQPGRNKKEVEQEAVKEQMAAVSVQQAADLTEKEKATNVFSGKIVDENNKPIPNATVIVINSQLGVSADTGGRFNFSFNDSVAPVNVSSPGFTPAQGTLKTGLTNTEIKLQRSSNTIDEAIVPALGRAKNAVTSAERITTTTPGIEPISGWVEYNSYILKNIRMPSGKEGVQEEVVLSFAIDNNGRPAQLKIEKPASPALNAEVLRLLKEGPAWKNTQQTRAVVTIRL